MSEKIEYKKEKISYSYSIVPIIVMILIFLFQAIQSGSQVKSTPQGTFSSSRQELHYSSTQNQITSARNTEASQLSSSRNNDDFLFLFLVFTGFSIASFLLIACYNGMTAIEPPLLTITDDAIYTIGNAYRNQLQMKYSDIHKIEYKIKTSSANDVTYTDRFLYFYDKKDKLLDKVNFQMQKEPILIQYKSKLKNAHLTSNGFILPIYISTNFSH